jgi:hypothetical protein
MSACLTEVLPKLNFLIAPTLLARMDAGVLHCVILPLERTPPTVALVPTSPPTLLNTVLVPFTKFVVLNARARLESPKKEHLLVLGGQDSLVVERVEAVFPLNTKLLNISVQDF